MKWIERAAALYLLALAGGIAAGSAHVLSTAGCTPALQAQTTDVTRIVLRDMLAGDSYAVVASDVTAALAALDAAVVDIDVAAVIEDAILFLVDTHQLPASAIAGAITPDGGPPSVLGAAHALRRPARP